MKCKDCENEFKDSELNENGYCKKCADKRKRNLQNRDWFPLSLVDSSSENTKTKSDDLER